MAATARRGAAPATHTTSRTTANVSYHLWQHRCWQGTVGGGASSSSSSPSALFVHSFFFFPESFTSTLAARLFIPLTWLAVHTANVSRSACSAALIVWSLLIRVSSVSPFSSGEWWLLPFLHSHLRLQQPGQQHSALPHPSHGSHQPPQLHRQEEEQEEGPQELM